MRKMMRFRTIALLMMASCAGASAQSVLDVFGISVLARSLPTELLTLAGTDGTTCSLVKIPSPSIYALFSCVSADGKQMARTLQIQSASANSGSITVGQGGVLCLVGINPTASSVAFGSVGTAPASGIAWSCTPGDGVTIKTGAIAWP
jgi:hypothetical protein